MSNNECNISPTSKATSDTSLSQLSGPSYSKCSSLWSQDCCSSQISCDFTDTYTPVDSLPTTFADLKKFRKNASSAKTINSIMQRRPSVINLENERQIFGHGLKILEPRPLIYWGGMEETMGLV